MIGVDADTGHCFARTFENHGFFRHYDVHLTAVSGASPVNGSGRGLSSAKMETPRRLPESGALGTDGSPSVIVWLDDRTDSLLYRRGLPRRRGSRPKGSRPGQRGDLKTVLPIHRPGGVSLERVVHDRAA